MSSDLCKVLIVCRPSCEWDKIPGCQSRPDDQELFLRDWLSRNVTAPVDVCVLNGDVGDHARDCLLKRTIAELSNAYDLVLVESLDRISRGFDMFRFLDLANDQQTRIVSVADAFDTTAPNTSLAKLLLASRYELNYVATQQRIRRSLSRRKKINPT